MTITDEPAIRDYYNLREQLDSLTKDMRDVIQHPNHCLQFLQPGRLVKIKYQEHDFGWGAVVNVTPRKPDRGEKLRDQESWILDCALVVASDTKYVPHSNNGLPPGIRPPPPGDKGKVESVPVLLTSRESIGHLRLFLPKEIKTTESKLHVQKALDEVKRRFPDGIAILDPIENMKIHDEIFKRTLRVCSTCSILASTNRYRRKSRS
jgi:ATP-dependent RNA helicase DOB1